MTPPNIQNRTNFETVKAELLNLEETVRNALLQKMNELHNSKDLIGNFDETQEDTLTEIKEFLSDIGIDVDVYNEQDLTFTQWLGVVLDDYQPRFLNISANIKKLYEKYGKPKKTTNFGGNILSELNSATREDDSENQNSSESVSDSTERIAGKSINKRRKNLSLYFKSLKSNNNIRTLSSIKQSDIKPNTAVAKIKQFLTKIRSTKDLIVEPSISDELKPGFIKNTAISHLPEIAINFDAEKLSTPESTQRYKANLTKYLRDTASISDNSERQASIKALVLAGIIKEMILPANLKSILIINIEECASRLTGAKSSKLIRILNNILHIDSAELSQNIVDLNLFIYDLIGINGDKLESEKRRPSRRSNDEYDAFKKSLDTTLGNSKITSEKAVKEGEKFSNIGEAEAIINNLQKSSGEEGDLKVFARTSNFIRSFKDTPDSEPLEEKKKKITKQIIQKTLINIFQTKDLDRVYSRIGNLETLVDTFISAPTLDNFVEIINRLNDGEEDSFKYISDELKTSLIASFAENMYGIGESKETKKQKIPYYRLTFAVVGIITPFIVGTQDVSKVRTVTLKPSAELSEAVSSQDIARLLTSNDTVTINGTNFSGMNYKPMEGTQPNFGDDNTVNVTLIESKGGDRYDDKDKITDALNKKLGKQSFSPIESTEIDEVRELKTDNKLKLTISFASGIVGVVSLLASSGFILSSLPKLLGSMPGLYRKAKNFKAEDATRRVKEKLKNLAKKLENLK